MQLGESPNALLAARDGKQFAVQNVVPVPIKSDFGKSSVERGPMAIAFAVRQRAIDIEDNCLKLHGARN